MQRYIAKSEGAVPFLVLFVSFLNIRIRWFSLKFMTVSESSVLWPLDASKKIKAEEPNNDLRMRKCHPSH